MLNFLDGVSRGFRVMGLFKGMTRNAQKVAKPGQCEFSELEEVEQQYDQNRGGEVDPRNSTD